MRCQKMRLAWLQALPLAAAPHALGTHLMVDTLALASSLARQVHMAQATLGASRTGVVMGVLATAATMLAARMADTAVV